MARIYRTDNPRPLASEKFQRGALKKMKGDIAAASSTT
jgi:hypothetical protein